VIPDGVDLEEFAPIEAAEARCRLGWSDRLPNVLFVGKPRLTTKNLALAQKVCAELTRCGRPVELRVAWEVDPVAMPMWMSGADALLCTSLSEGSPNAVKEAMAAELPIVPGAFVVERSVPAMADALAAALDGGRTPAARRAVQELSLERVGERVLEVYREVAR
jgi:glycosyltransferase involved in cell wall biosynthesis